MNYLLDSWFVIDATRKRPLVDDYIEVFSVADFVRTFGADNPLYWCVSNYFREAPYKSLITNGVDEVYTPYQWDTREDARARGESFWHVTALMKKVC